MARDTKPNLDSRLKALAEELSAAALSLDGVFRTRAAGKVRTTLAGIEHAARLALSRLDPIAVPKNVFDPTSPDVAAWTVVLALIAQPRVKLAEVAPEYGAGVYALYYVGDHPSYQSISRTETPIYVGKADPARSATADVRTHGDSLTRRLSDHRRQIRMAEDYGRNSLGALIEQGLYALSLNDFECRKLVCAPGLQLTAESRLIGLFRPLWNSDFDVAHGISKHGDRQRRHPKSPWDVLHPGRSWADGLQENGEPFPDQLTAEDIGKRIEAHVPTMGIFRKHENVVAAVLKAFGQDPATASPELAEELEEQAEESGQ